MSRWSPSAVLASFLAAALAAVMALGAPAPAGVPQNTPGAPAARPEAKPAQDAVTGPIERWAGTIFLPAEIKIDFALQLQRVQDRQTGKLSIPSQNLAKQSLRDVSRDGDSISFTLGEPNPQPAWAKFALTSAPDGTAAGTMTQGGQTFPVKMERLAEGEADRAGLKAGDGAGAANLPGDRWDGGVDLPDMTLGINVRLQAGTGGGAPSGTMSIPMQGVTDAGLHDVVIEKSRLRFVFRPAAPENTWARFDLKVSDDGNGADGQMVQMGAKFPAKFHKLAPGEAPKSFNRPQEPKGPFPYGSKDVAFRNENANITLAGTLTTPKGPGPFPCALMITGSGPQDRDEMLLGHKPFLVIADHLSRNGIAVLRVDDRGVGKSGGNFASGTSEDFADDARAGIAFLKTCPEVRADQIGLIGHSEGGLITSKIAGDPAAEGGVKAGVAWIVMMAGPGVSGLDIMIDQSSEMVAPPDADRKKVQAAADAARTAAELVMKGAPNDQVRAAVRRLVDASVELAGDEARKAMGEGPAGAESMTDRLMTMLTSAWFRYFLSYDPRPDLARIRVPVLVLNGSLDRQVRADQNLPEVEKALRAGGNTRFEVVKLEGLNHLFQTATTGKPEEYAVIEETVSPRALDVITAWIRKQTGPAK
jgi:pimeloyl-ACP methyl ester carboxylesterase